MRKNDHGNEPVTVEKALVVAKTDNALLIRTDAGEEGWVPKSQICEDSEIDEEASKNDQGDLIIPRWLAEAKEFTYEEAE